MLLLQPNARRLLPKELPPPDDYRAIPSVLGPDDYRAIVRTLIPDNYGAMPSLLGPDDCRAMLRTLIPDNYFATPNFAPIVLPLLNLLLQAEDFISSRAIAYAYLPGLSEPSVELSSRTLSPSALPAFIVQNLEVVPPLAYPRS